MATNILMPALSPTMTEGTLARWLKQEGDEVRAGDVVAEIETDKASMEVEAVDEGILGKILVPDGTANVKVNAPIGVLVAEGEDVGEDGGEDGGGGAVAVADAPAEQASGGAPQESGPAATPGKAAAPAGAADGGDRQPAQSNGAGAAAAAEQGRDRIFASPLARRMAKQAGIDLSSLKGSGPNGRIVRADIETAHKGEAPQAQTVTAKPEPSGAAAPSVPQAATGPKPAALTGAHTLRPHTSMRRTIARRLVESKQHVPHFYVTMDVELDALLRLRADLNARAPADGPGAFKLSVNDLVIKAAAAALRRMPKVNASWLDDGIAEYQDVDISVAVAIPDGLITPVIRKADQKGLAAISSEMKELAARAKAGKLKPEEYQGGGFSISNMGMYGVRDFAAIINPPQGAILAIGAGEKRPVVKSDSLAIATVMTCTLSVDHRVIDGALGAEWLALFKSLVEDPLGLLL